jgi:hypothetical protein
MIYAIVGTKKEVREKAARELLSLGDISRYVYSEEAKDIKHLIDGASLFGDTIVVSCFSLGESTSSKEILVENIKDMADSNTLFIVDEPFGDVHMFNRLSKVAKKIFDAREERVKDVSVFSLCTFFVARNKKDAWVTFFDVKKRESGEAIAGALWWKFQSIWQGVISGKRSLFTEEECRRIGKDLTLAPILAHRGEKDLMLELERIILSI